MLLVLRNTITAAAYSGLQYRDSLKLFGWESYCYKRFYVKSIGDDRRHVSKLPAPIIYGAFFMEYNFLADFLAKFSSLTPWIQGVIVISATAIPVCFFYFFNRVIVKALELLATKRKNRGFELNI